MGKHAQKKHAFESFWYFSMPKIKSGICLQIELELLPFLKSRITSKRMTIELYTIKSCKYICTLYNCVFVFAIILVCLLPENRCYLILN